MIGQICDYIHNHFIREVLKGEFTVNNGGLQGLTLQPSQYIEISGSMFCDGIHRADEPIRYDGLNVTETFEGAVALLAIPDELLKLADEIKAYVAKNGDAIDSPYTSESFGGYSYTKATNADGTSGADWRSVYGSRLGRWRKL